MNILKLIFKLVLFSIAYHIVMYLISLMIKRFIQFRYNRLKRRREAVLAEIKYITIDILSLKEYLDLRDILEEVK